VTIQNGYEHGEIFIRHGSREGRDGHPQNWVTFACHTTFGAYSNHWSHIGPNDWRAFIQNGDMDHVMSKFCPGKWEEVDFEATVESFQKTLLDVRREGDVDKDEAREARERLEGAISQARDYESQPAAAVAILLDQISGEEWATDAWESVKRRPNGQAKGFFEQIWTPFCQEMARELEAERIADLAEEVTP
jgi:hypothetical protein